MQMLCPDVSYGKSVGGFCFEWKSKANGEIHNSYEEITCQIMNEILNAMQTPNLAYYSVIVSVVGILVLLFILCVYAYIAVRVQCMSASIAAN